MRAGFKEAIRISLIFLLLGGFGVGSSFAQKDKIKPINQVVVIDSNGKAVGTNIGGMGIHSVSETSGSRGLRPTVLINVNQQIVAVNVARDRFFGGNLYYESLDCGSTPWLATEVPGGLYPAPLLPPSAIGSPGGTVYVAMEGVSPFTMTAKSRLLEGLVCQNGEIFIKAVPAQPLVDLLTVFTPPFSLRAAP